MTRESAAAQFDALMRMHVPALYRHAYRWTGDVDQAEDLVQEALTRLFPELPRLLTVDKPRPWATRVMYRIFVDQLRRSRRSPVVFVGRSGSSGDSGVEDEESEAADDGPGPAELSERELDRERIAAAWPRLHEQHRVVLSLHDIEGYSLEEVAGIIDAPLGTAKSRLHRARRHLRDLLTGGTESPAPACIPAATP
jgi:RNA polymerase sigma factor (sigma-70 family)